MKIAWYLGFGWLSIGLLLASGVAINLLTGPVVWAFYLPFIAAGLHMSTRFKLFNRERWRRVHAKAMQTYGSLAGLEFDAARAQQREFDVRIPCTGLAQVLFPARSVDEIKAMLGPQRKVYYRRLLDACEPVFLSGVADDRHAAVLAGIQNDIEASALGPDVVVVQTIEQQLGMLSAAHYFQARLLGRVN